MAKGTRITLTKREAESAVGKELIEQILSICHDGEIEAEEIQSLQGFLEKADSEIAAIGFLRAHTREVLADGVIDDAEAYRLKQAFERVVPKEVRDIVSTHLEAIGLPLPPVSDETPEWLRTEWLNDEATPRQIEFIRDLGGRVKPGMTKEQASDLIQELLERRPPSPRQKMLLRFFDRLDLMDATKDEVNAWIDELFATKPSHERAWGRFKVDTAQDPSCRDPETVPVGAYKRYVSESSGREHARRSGCAPLLLLCAILVLSLLVAAM